MNRQMNIINHTVFYFLCFFLMPNPLLFGQELKIDFPEGKIIIEGAANLNLEGYDGKEVIVLEAYYEQNRPDLELGLEKINSRKSMEKLDLKYKIKGKELRLTTDMKTTRYVIKIPKNLNVFCKTFNGDYYYYDGLKSMNLDNIEGEIEILSQGGIDVNLKNIVNSVSVVTYGNITATVKALPSEGILSFDSYLGHVNLSLPSELSANLNLSAKKGDIFSNLPLNRNNNNEHSKQVVATLGNGGIDIIINVQAGGDIYLREKIEQTVDFIHKPNAKHYIISRTKKAIMRKKASLIKTNIFMQGMKQRYSNIWLEPNQEAPLFIIRSFDSFDAALDFAKVLNKESGIPNDFLPISVTNYRLVLKEKSTKEYRKFFLGIVGKK